MADQEEDDPESWEDIDEEVRLFVEWDILAITNVVGLK